jgi:serine/threonine protein kinase
LYYIDCGRIFGVLARLRLFPYQKRKLSKLLCNERSRALVLEEKYHLAQGVRRPTTALLPVFETPLRAFTMATPGEIGLAVAFVLLLGAFAAMVVYHIRSANRMSKLSRVHELELGDKGRELLRLGQALENLEAMNRAPESSVDLINMEMESTDEEERRILKAMEIDGRKLELKELLGRGSYAEVRRAIYRGTPVAVKLLKDPDMKRFKEEILLMKDLRHPNIVQLLGPSWNLGQLMIVTELFYRGNLADVLADRNLRLTWKSPMYDMIRDVARGMAYLHSARYYDCSTKTYQHCIIHRDLKPQNMLVTEHMGVKITDFGEARAVDSDYTMTQVGTLLYIAPEIVRGDKYDEKCDVYSFGVTLMAMLLPERTIFELFVEELQRETDNGAGMDLIVSKSGEMSEGSQQLQKPKRYTPYMVTVATVNQHLRPHIPDEALSSIALLVQQSWDPNPSNRPTFKEILDYIETIVKEELFDGVPIDADLLAPSRGLSRFDSNSTDSLQATAQQRSFGAAGTGSLPPLPKNFLPEISEVPAASEPSMGVARQPSPEVVVQEPALQPAGPRISIAGAAEVVAEAAAAAAAATTGAPPVSPKQKRPPDYKPKPGAAALENLIANNADLRERIERMRALQAIENSGPEHLPAGRPGPAVAGTSQGYRKSLPSPQKGGGGVARFGDEAKRERALSFGSRSNLGVLSLSQDISTSSSKGSNATLKASHWPIQRGSDLCGGHLRLSVQDIDSGDSSVDRAGDGVVTPPAVNDYCEVAPQKAGGGKRRQQR